MGEGKRQRTSSRSPPPLERSRHEDDGREGSRRGRDRSSSPARDRSYRDRDRDRDRDPPRDRDRDGDFGRERSGRDRDSREGGGPGRGSAFDRDRERDEGPGAAARRPRPVDGEDGDRRPRGEHREERGSREDRGLPPPPPGRNGAGAGGGGRREHDGERDGGWRGGEGRGGGGGRGRGRGGGRRGGRDDHGDGDMSRYMSKEEREDREREAEEAAKPKAPKEQPNLGLSGKLAAETNKVAGGAVLKHVPPPEARKPDKRWRLYIFKNDQLQDEPFHIHRMDHYLFGRDVAVADIITAHPSCSKQHAVLQFRVTEKEDEYGLRGSAVRPYLLDLGSVNGSFLNGERMEPLRYYELLEKDVVRFGQSTREYVLLHDQSGGDDD